MNVDVDGDALSLIIHSTTQGENGTFYASSGVDGTMLATALHNGDIIPAPQLRMYFQAPEVAPTRRSVLLQLSICDRYVCSAAPVSIEFVLIALPHAPTPVSKHVMIAQDTMTPITLQFDRSRVDENDISYVQITRGTEHGELYQVGDDGVTIGRQVTQIDSGSRLIQQWYVCM